MVYIAWFGGFALLYIVNILTSDLSTFHYWYYDLFKWNIKCESSTYQFVGTIHSKIDQKYQSWKQIVIIVLFYSFAHRQIIMLRQDAYQVLRNKLVIFCRSLFWLLMMGWFFSFENIQCSFTYTIVRVSTGIANTAIDNSCNVCDFASLHSSGLLHRHGYLPPIF
jgi:hypothetical protein